MKTKIAFICVALASTINAQQWNGTSPSTNADRTGNTGIGTSSPSFKLQVVESSGNTQASDIILTANSAGNFTALKSSASDNGSASDLIGIKSEANGGGLNNYGVVGIGGGSTNPSGGNFGGYFKLSTTGSNNYINAAVFGDDNNLGTPDTYGGYFNGRLRCTGLLQGDADMNINGYGLVNGNIHGNSNLGINLGTMIITNGKVEARTDVSGSGINTAGHFTSFGNKFNVNGHYGVLGRATSSNGLSPWMVGVQGEAITTNNCNPQNMGVYGWAEGANYNVGGLFVGAGTDGGSACCVQNIGVWGTISIGCSATQSWAGWFNGDVGATGAFITVSDRKLKEDIKPMESMLDRIMKLKPSTYTFKTEETFEDLNLPKGKQFGLIAQDLEEVFPELITNVSETKAKGTRKDIHTPEFKGVQYLPLISVLIAGLQEQQKAIIMQTQENSDLKLRISELEKNSNQKNSELTSNSENSKLTSGFYLKQNVPNPTSAETSVELSIDNSFSSAFLGFYDLTGKQIYAVSIENVGKTVITIPAGKLSPGIYNYSLVKDGQILDTRKMIVQGN